MNILSDLYDLRNVKSDIIASLCPNKENNLK